jgi:cell division septation protein DedD
MFTVGILVGKGLSQARYENLLAAQAERMRTEKTAPFAQAPAAGTSITTPQSQDATSQHEQTKHEEHASAPGTTDADKAVQDAKLELIPSPDGGGVEAGTGLAEPKANVDMQKVLNNPKLRNLFDSDGAQPEVKRSVASVSVPVSFAKGAFSVQIGSYPNEKDASERVGALKKIGFAHAFFSPKEIREKNDTWFRVWLGYLQNEVQAKEAGQALKDMGEIKDYLVREAHQAGTKN